MKKLKRAVAFCLCAVLCAGFFACGQGDDKGDGAGSSITSGMESVDLKTAFTNEEESRFQALFGFVVPFIATYRYRVETYEGYNADLCAEESGLAFFAETASEDECKAYLENLRDDENYNYEYREGNYHYFSRDGYFVKVSYYRQATAYELAVFAYSYRFEDNGSADSSVDSSSAPGSDSSSEFQQPEFGFEYEKDRDNSYSIIGFYGDEDGIVEIPDFYNGLPIRYIRANAFYAQESIVELIVGNSVWIIEGNAFMLCSNLQKITFGNGLELIDMQAFFGCESLEEVAIPASVTFIGSGAFGNCVRLKSIALADPNGWARSADAFKKVFPAEEMSNAATVAEYFTETYKGSAWEKIDK